MIAIHNINLVENGMITPCEIGIEKGRIDAIEAPGVLSGRPGTACVDGEGQYLSHGFVDIHVHGGGGYDFMDADLEAWHHISTFHLRYGTTQLVPTTLAADREGLLAALDAYMACGEGFEDGADFLGIHVEGPYLAAAQCGAQDPRYIRRPERKEYEEMIERCPRILRWTIAPEIPGALEMGDYLMTKGIVPCIGHSDATCEEVRKALLHGYSHITHLYSAMSTIVRRQGFRHAGIVESAYLFPELSSEVIADGCHLPGDLLNLAYRQIGPDRLCLITDAMRAAGQMDGESILGGREDGQRVIIEDGVAKLPDRKAFAGSICTADRLVRTMIQQGGASLPDAIRMITATPAAILGLERETGSVKMGRKADLVLFDRDIHIRKVFRNGILQYAE